MTNKTNSIRGNQRQDRRHQRQSEALSVLLPEVHAALMHAPLLRARVVDAHAACRHQEVELARMHRGHQGRSREIATRLQAPRGRIGLHARPSPYWTPDEGRNPIGTRNHLKPSEATRPMREAMRESMREAIRGHHLDDHPLA